MALGCRETAAGSVRHPGQWDKCEARAQLKTAFRLRPIKGSGKWPLYGCNWKTVVAHLQSFGAQSVTFWVPCASKRCHRKQCWRSRADLPPTPTHPLPCPMTEQPPLLHFLATPIKVQMGDSPRVSPFSGPAAQATLMDPEETQLRPGGRALGGPGAPSLTCWESNCGPAWGVQSDIESGLS